MKLKEMLKNVEDVELTEEQEKQIKDYLGIKNSKKWRPEKGEKYFYIASNGTIVAVTYAEPEYSDYKFHILSNNYFKTKEEAEFRLEQIKVYNELKNFADENNDEEIDWYSSSQIKWRMYFDYANSILNVSGWSTIRSQGAIYFTSEELAKQAIEKVGEDRIKKYLFGVWDK